MPVKQEPISAHMILVSPLKNDINKDGSNVGEDNFIRSIDIKHSDFQFEMSDVLCRRRFLGDRHAAFATSNRTFIVALDRLKEGMRVARRNKTKNRKEENNN